ncbi:hypothetical protein NE237_005275 [Protea cynaroides]|uniref:Uncharacterized protein n=1 Tax=Protea cynaroides TaxID=273540 RepID=A0A9Q0KKI0_9MAGN|nr:hypothetical protein NE237_005275 [Protea cynaroides]
MTFLLPPSDFSMTITESSHYNNPITVVGIQFCAPHPVDLIIVMNLKSLDEGNFSISDVNGNIVFKAKGTLLSFHDRHLLHDTKGDHLLSLRHKIMSLHSRWQVFKGDSSDSQHLLFSVKKSSWNSSWVLDVFMAANTKEEVCDFKIKGSWAERSCIIYIGDSKTIIAQMHKNNGVQSTEFGKGSFTVTVYPNVDYAFIAALIVITASFSRGSTSTSMDMGTIGCLCCSQF